MRALGLLMLATGCSLLLVALVDAFVAAVLVLFCACAGAHVSAWAGTVALGGGLLAAAGWWLTACSWPCPPAD